MNFFKQHLLGMAIFAIVTGICASFLYDYFGSVFTPNSVQSTSQEGYQRSPINQESNSDLRSTLIDTSSPDKLNPSKRTLSPAFASTSLPLREWDNCVEQAESSVSQHKVGVWGIEAAISEQCGKPPIIDSDSMLGVSPYHLVRSKTWTPDFRLILGEEYDGFVKRIVVSSYLGTKLEGGWVVANGQMPHEGGFEMAAFAINKKTRDVYAAVLKEGKYISGFGFGPSWDDAPPYLRQWMIENKQ